MWNSGEFGLSRGKNHALKNAKNMKFNKEKL
jgi:hypothetical protein